MATNFAESLRGSAARVMREHEYALAEHRAPHPDANHRVDAPTTERADLPSSAQAREVARCATRSIGTVSNPRRAASDVTNRSMSQRAGGHLAAHDASSVLSTDAVRSNN